MTEPTLRTIYAVSELAQTLRALVEDSLPRVWVEGEISNFSRPASGHWYFTIKDAKSQLRCAMFRGANQLVRPQPANGDRVLLRASVSFYTARGDLQLICEHMEPAGEGALLQAFEALKRRLAGEGLFDEALKRPIPAMPSRIGLITSGTGAAVQDVKAALARRFGMAKVFLWPVPVQGDAAAPAIVKALQQLPQRAPVDVILLVRGGGSLEDLWAFNEEIVARAVRACTVPVVSGIGHEIDTTICDYVADLRATTPTAAAELVSPDARQLLHRIAESEVHLAEALEDGMAAKRAKLEQLQARLRLVHPQRAIQDRAQRLDEIEHRLTLTTGRHLTVQRARLEHLRQRLSAQHPARALRQIGMRLDASLQRLIHAQRGMLRQHEAQLDRASAILKSLSPKAVLDRGYALARLQDGTVLRNPNQVPADAEFELLLAQGQIRARRTPPERS